MNMSDYICTIVRTKHRFSDKHDIIENGTIDR